MKKIVKGMLLWLTILTIVLFISGVDSIISQGYLGLWLLVCVTECCLCFILISKEEFNTLSGLRWFNSKLGGEDE